MDGLREQGRTQERSGVCRRRQGASDAAAAAGHGLGGHRAQAGGVVHLAHQPRRADHHGWPPASSQRGWNNRGRLVHRPAWSHGRHRRPLHVEAHHQVPGNGGGGAQATVRILITDRSGDDSEDERQCVEVYLRRESVPPCR